MAINACSNVTVKVECGHSLTCLTKPCFSGLLMNVVKMAFESASSRMLCSQKCRCQISRRFSFCRAAVLRAVYNLNPPPLRSGGGSGRGCKKPRSDRIQNELQTAPRRCLQIGHNMMISFAGLVKACLSFSRKRAQINVVAWRRFCALHH